MPYHGHLNAAAELVTPYEAIRAGFVAQALEKNRRGSPFVQQARDLKTAAEQAATPHALLDMQQIQAGLLTAAAVSDKAYRYFTPEDRRAAIVNLIDNFLLPAGDNFVEELVYRFLLTRGETLGGSMRNYGGLIAEQRVSAALLARMRNQGTPFLWRQRNGRWARPVDDDAATALMMRGISWMVGGQPRSLVYNRKVEFVRNKNIDLCLLRLAPADLNPAAYRAAANYIALGELKGGIDPAGADEHWKTATRSLDRIAEGLANANVAGQIFFIGAAIAADMAEEIWEKLQAGTLTEAANLTYDNQLAGIIQWLTAL